MRIISTDGEFDVQVGFKTQLTIYNTFVTDEGEQSNPITLPSTPNNLKLIKYSNRIDDYFKPVTDISVLVIDGLMIRNANMSISSSDEEDGIICTLYLGDSEFYSRVDEVMISALNWPIIKSPTYETQTATQRVDWLINYVKSQFLNPTADSLFYTAPVKTSETFQYNISGTNTSRAFYLNGFHRWHTLDFTGDPGLNLDVLEGESGHIVVIDGSNVSINKGYGITPFLKLDYVMRFLFESYGYTLINNYRPTWSITGIINTVADAVYAGVLRFSQLLPATTIKDFIQQIETVYGGRFLFDNSTKTVSFIGIYDAFTATPVDLTRYLTSRPRKGQADFTLLNFIDGRKSSDSQIANTTMKTEDIQIDCLTTMLFDYENAEVFPIDANPNIKTVDIAFNTITTSSKLVHKNSYVIIDNKKTEDEEKAATKVQLAEFISSWKEAGFRTDPGAPGLHVYYKHAYEVFHADSSNGLTDMRSISDQYIEYSIFRHSSAVPVSCKMRLPVAVLYGLNKTTPVIINNVRMLIESIKFPTDNEHDYVDCELELLTYMQYYDR